MMKYQIRTTEQMLAYITDCTLATVCDMACKKSIPRNEFSRQIEIAQTAINWMVQAGIDTSTTRAEDVLEIGSVRDWALTFTKD